MVRRRRLRFAERVLRVVQFATNEHRRGEERQERRGAAIILPLCHNVIFHKISRRRLTPLLVYRPKLPIRFKGILGRLRAI
jgi:hypothetical protein